MTTWTISTLDEASLAAKIEADKNPTQAAGVPW